MRLLELFSGTGSVGIPWREKGYEVMSVDIDNRYNPEVCDDILQVKYQNFQVPDCIWASPPCDQYSLCRTKAKAPRNLTLADSLVAKAIEIIQYFQKLNPDLIWFIENGDSTMLWGREVAKDLQTYVVLDYCQYNGPGLYRKRTRIAHSDNLLWNPRSLCDPKTCEQCIDCKHIRSAQRGPAKGKDKKLDKCTLDTLHGLPRELTEEILRICQQHIWEVV